MVSRARSSFILEYGFLSSMACCSPLGRGTTCKRIMRQKTVRSGRLEADCIWTLDDEGTFTISTADGGPGTLWSPLLTMSQSLRSKIVHLVIAQGVKAPKDATHLFAEMNITSIDAANLDVSETVCMNGMFQDCPSLTDISSLST